MKKIKEKQDKDYLEGYWFGRKKLVLEVMDILNEIQKFLHNKTDMIVIRDWDLEKAMEKIKKLCSKP